MRVHLCNVARDSAENIEGRHTLVAAARRQGQVTLHVHAGATLLSPFCRCAPSLNIFKHFEFVGHVSKFLRPHEEN